MILESYIYFIFSNQKINKRYNIRMDIKVEERMRIR